MEILITYFKAGLENNEFCLWVTSQPVEVKDAKEALSRAIPDFNTYLERGQIEIIPYTDWFITNGVFDSKRVSNSRFERLNHALDIGYSGMRLSGNTTWLEKENWSSFIEFKEQTDKAMDTYKMVNLCTYFLDRHNAAEIIDVVVNHQFALIKREGKWKCIESPKRKQAEEAVLQATKNWEYTFDAVPDLISILDTEYRIVRANKAMAARLGTTPEECVGLTCYRVICETDEPPSFCPHSQMLKDGLEHTREVHEDSLGGDFIVSVSPLHDSEGKLTGCIHVARDITKRKRAEKALRESEELLRFALETSHTGAWDLDLADHTAHRSLEHDRIFGYEQLLPEWTYEMFLDHVLPEDREMVDAKFREATTTRSDWSFECRIRRVDGEIRWIWAAGRHRVDAAGGLRRMAGIVQDITERKRMEEALKKVNETLEEKVKERTAELEKAYNSLKESEASLAEAQKMAHIGNWDWDLVTNELHASDEICRIFGLNSQEFDATYEAFLNYVHPADRDYINTAFKDVLNGKKLVSTDYRIVSAEGEERVVHGQGEIIFNEENIPVKMRGTIQDITELKRTEKALELSEERYRIIAEQTGQLVYDYNIKGNTLDWAGNIEEITGYTPDKFRNMSLQFWISRIHPEDRKMFLESYERFLRDGGIYRTEYRFRKENGEYIYVEDNGVYLKGEEGKVKRILGATKNITERKQAEEALANIETARKREIHHRIKNNLQVISSLLDLQAEKFRDRKHTEDSDVLAAFKESQDRVLSIALIHEELHEDKGTDKLNFCPYLEKLVENLFETYRVGNVDLRLNIDLEENIFFDIDVAVPLGLIVNEIVSNSLKYAFSGRNKGIIQIKLCKEENIESVNNTSGSKKGNKNKVTNFILTVSDNGMGIPENINLEDSDTLGLQLIVILIDQLEGKLELKRDSGTEFVIKFAVQEKQ